MNPDHVPAGLVAVTDRGRILRLNRWLRGTLGWDADAAAPESVDQLFNPASRLLFHSYLMPLLQLHGEVAGLTLVLRHRNGEDLDVLLRASRRTDPEHPQREARVHLVLFPWTERRRLEQQLLSAKRAAEQVPGLIFELLREPSGRYRFPYVSDAVRHIHGVAPQPVLADARHLLTTVARQDRVRLREAFEASARTLHPVRLEFQVEGGPEPGWRETHAEPRPQPDGSVQWHGYTADITERKALLAEVTAREAAQQAAASRNLFLARVSHELRTPLNGILGFTQLLQDATRGVVDAEHRRQLGHIEQAGRTLLKLVNEVLEISRIEAGGLTLQLEPVSLAEAIANASALVQGPARARHVQLLNEPPVAPVHALADEQRLLQCLGNLLSNAIKYGPPGGRLWLRWGEDAGRAWFELRDEGPGFSAEQLAHLFEPFNRLGAERSKVEGTGLGLSITRGLMEAMSGQISARNHPAGGAVFRLELSAPACPARPHAEAPAPAVAPPEPANRPPACVLYVEDNDVNAMLMEAVLQMRPHLRLVRAATAQEALDWLQAHTPELLLLDLQLPDMSGWDLLGLLRQDPRHRALPVVAVSADMPQDSPASLGLDDYWSKPIELARVLPVLDRLCAARPA